MNYLEALESKFNREMESYKIEKYYEHSEQSKKIANLKQALNDIREYIKSESPDAGVSGKRILQIIYQVLGEDK